MLLFSSVSFMRQLVQFTSYRSTYPILISDGHPKSFVAHVAESSLLHETLDEVDVI